MKVDLYERIWMWAAMAMLVAFVGALLIAAAAGGMHPPSHLETIDPARLRIDTDFTRTGVTVDPDGRLVVRIVTSMFAFDPAVVRVPAARPVTFRLASPDVVHGFQIVGANANVLVAPGYVSELTTTFPRAGEYLIVCNEYCGLAHHLMQATLVVEEAR